MNKRYERTVHISEALDNVISQVRALPVVTVGDAATDKATEVNYLDNNWTPLANTRYLINDAGQLREERRRKQRGSKNPRLYAGFPACYLQAEVKLAEGLQKLLADPVEADKATRYGSDVQEID